MKIRYTYSERVFKSVLVAVCGLYDASRFCGFVGLLYSLPLG